jgi:phosphopantothenoylcysteine decarboxylase/phosphopantothenate--cysteine ligase
LLAVYLSATCPVVVSPAMDEDMWHHPATKRNIELLQSFGNSIIDVEKGELASGLIGEGRMAEPETIVQYLIEHFFRGKELSGKKILITAGPTYEAIDPVRFIGNHSSGKMGLAIAKELYARGAEVTLVMGPSLLDYSPNGIKVEKVTSAAEMLKACQDASENADIMVMSAAVADYKPVKSEDKKIKKRDDRLTLELTKTDDILKHLGEKKRDNQVLVGFALETENERQYALQKMAAKNADVIVLNSLNDEGAGFGHDTNKITIFSKNGEEFKFDTKSKSEVAKDIVDTIIRINYV